MSSKIFRFFIESKIIVVVGLHMIIMLLLVSVFGPLGSMFGVPWYEMSYVGLVIFVQ